MSDDSGSPLGSDFAVMDEEYSCDSEGNIKGEDKAKKRQADNQSTDTVQNLEERRRQKRLAKLDKKIK